jgi:hypothetical protein
MASEHKLTISYSLKPPSGTEPPISKQSGKPIPSSETLTFQLGDKATLDYKKLLSAIQEAKEVTGSQVLTPWRDAVGDKEKGKDAKVSKPVAVDEEEEDEDIA